MSRPLRILYVVPGFPRDLAEPGLPSLLDLVERVAALHQVTIVALHHPPTRQPYSLAGARVVPLAVPSGTGLAGRARVLARGVAELVRQRRRAGIDVIHALWADEPGAVAVLAAPLVRARALVSILGGELVALPDIGYGAALGRGGRWTARLALSRADALTVGSGYSGDIARAARPRVAPQLVPLGVDTELFSPAARDASAAGPLVLFVGSLEPVKDPLAALRVFAPVASSRREARLVFCGEGSLRPALERAAAELGVRDQVELRGHVPRGDLPALHSAAAAMLVTSRHEGEHVASIEAAASGVPILGYAVGALPDLADGALTVAPGNEAGLATALASVLDDADMARRISAAARAVALANYDVRTTTQAHLDIYERLCRRA